jgi:hypothetical protein
MNLDREYWVKKFLYPFACDTAPIKLADYPISGPTLGSVQDLGSKAKAGEKFDVLETKRF